MKFKEKSEIVDELIELMKKSLLNRDQKQKILNIVNEMNIATENQKNRFILFYGLDENRSDYRTLGKIAKKDNCTTSAVRLSIITVRNKLSRLKEEFEIIEQIVNECQNNMNERVI